ncbi:MAG TPA: hypothetical protein VG147_16545 [Solirubrobacteraceae bacterium]|jgi:hypothetical protein|nr:hypothetical protein [Solirubrobacteraceae bacterium]
MPAHHSAPPTTAAKQLDRAIILQLLRDDHRERWSDKQIERALPDFKPEAIHKAIVRLEAGGVICCLDEFIGASRCAQYLDSLELISI